MWVLTVCRRCWPKWPVPLTIPCFCEIFFFFFYRYLIHINLKDIICNDFVTKLTLQISSEFGNKMNDWTGVF